LPGAYNQAIYGGGGFDAFLMKFDNSGARKWATYYGGSELDRARASCMDNLGNLYVSGNTFSTDFPVMNMSGAYNQTSLGGVDGMNDLFILSFNNDYCNSGSSNYSHVYISDVVLNDLSNSSGGSYYSDFTDLIMSATQGTSYPVSLSFWKDHGSLKADWRVWIDLNIDGDFDDAGELVFSVDNKSGSANGTITIPSSTSVGLTRMRISMRDGSGDFGPCDVHNSGEVEDYAVDLQPVVALPPVADFEGTPTTVTVGNSVDFSDLSLNDPTSWAWSFEGGTPLNSTDQNPTVTYYTEGTYEVSLTATNAEGSDIETKLNYIIVESGGGCNTVSNVFPKDPLTHSGTGFSSTSYDFGAPGHSDVSFVVSDLGAKIKGSPNNRYIDLVTISYTDNIGSQIFGTFSGENTNTVNVDISGPVYSVTITLEDGYDGNPPGTLSVDPSSISSCPPAGASPQIDDFSDNRFNSNILDLSVYPNPTSEFLTIRYELNKESDVEMTLTDINGQNVHNLKLHQFAAVLSNKIDVSHMPEGIYFFHMRSEDQVTSRKIIIMK
jgi:PKD repeat protein